MFRVDSLPDRCSGRKVYGLDLDDVAGIILTAEVERVVAGHLDTRGSVVLVAPWHGIVINVKVDGVHATQVEGDTEGLYGCGTSAHGKGDKSGNSDELHFDG